MFRSGSEAAPRHGRGFTLIEVMIAVTVGVILGVVVVRFYRDSYHAYSLQDQVQERDQNAQFVVTRLTEILQQAGSGLPDTGWTIISQSGTVTTLAVNPSNAMQFISWNPGSSQFVAVSDATPWKTTGNVLLNFRYVLLDSAAPKGCSKISMDTSYSDSGFVKGVKDNSSGLDSIRLTAAVDLSIGDKLYGYREDQYLLGGTSGTNLIVRSDGNVATQMVLAENIEALTLTFKTAAGIATTTWKQMRSATLSVRARTAIFDPRISGGYRKITLPMNINLRNRL